MAEMGLLDRLINFFVVNEDIRTKQWLLSDTPGPLFTILGTYLYFCLYAGPRFMKDRKPFQLKNVLIWYNAIQVVFSAILVWEGLEGGWRKHYNYRCEPVDYTNNPVAMRMARAVWFYYMCKVIELLDTVFFVLRKNQRQVTFLHVYHHSLMPICGFIGTKYFAGGHGTLLGLINSFIHVLMYGYYMFSAMGPHMQKYLWWKKYLTLAQIVQFVIVFAHATQIQFQPDCAFSKGIGCLLSINSGLFLYMFSAFYVKTYNRNKKQQQQQMMSNGVGHAKKDLLDAPPMAKPQELNRKEEGSKGGLSGYMDDFNNNVYYPDRSKETTQSTMSPLYAKLVQNGHFSGTESGLKLD